MAETPDRERRRLAPTLRTYVTLWGGEANRSRFLYHRTQRVFGPGTPPRKGGGSSALSSYRSGGSIPGGHVREPSGDRPDSLAGSSGAVARGPALGAVRDSCRKTDGREPA